MKPCILKVTLLPALGASWLAAADPQLLNLVMPDAKILAGINVAQAKTSPFGQYLVTQFEAQDKQLQEVAAQTGFDPTRDLDELLVASTGTHDNGLVLARGRFDSARIDAAAQSAGGISESYKGNPIVEDARRTHGFAFLNSSIVIAGDLASVKSAIDRQTAPAPLPASLLVRVNQLSTTEDAWGISLVPPPPIHPPTNNVPNVPATIFQNVQQASGGVKLGAQVVLTAEFQTDTPQNATTLANMLQFLVNLAAMNARQGTQAGSVLKDVSITTNASLVDFSLSVPESEAESLFQLKPRTRHAQPIRIPRQGK